MFTCEHHRASMGIAHNPTLIIPKSQQLTSFEVATADFVQRRPRAPSHALI